MKHCILGIDPGVAKIGLAVVSGSSRTATDFLWAGVAKGKTNLRTIRSLWFELAHIKVHYGTKITGIVIEGQEYYLTDQERKSKPEDLIKVAFMAGAAAGICTNAFGSEDLPIKCPLPKEWKGNVPKHIKQERILKELNIPVLKHVGRGGKFPVPKPTMMVRNNVTDSCWYDILDAAGLALWGLEEL